MEEDAKTASSDMKGAKSGEYKERIRDAVAGPTPWKRGGRRRRGGEGGRRKEKEGGRKKEGGKMGYYY